MNHVLWQRPLLALSLAALCACSQQKTESPQGPKVEGDLISFPADSAQLKALVSIEAKPVTDENLHVSGRLVWDQTRTVSVYAPLDGRITLLKVEPGDTVKAGAPLATLSSPSFGEAQAEAIKSGADFVVAEKSLDRARHLNQAGITADKELQKAEAEYASALAEKRRTQARINAYGGSNGGEQQLTLRAPIAGVVVERHASPGQEVRADQAQDEKALFVISDPAHLWVQLELPEAALTTVERGMTLSLKVAALEEEPLTAKITHIADFIDPVTRTTRARACVDNKDRKLKAEMFATADIPVKRPPHLRLPTQAVILLGQQQYIFLDEGNGNYRRMPVRAEEAGFGQMRVLDAMPENHRIVTDGALLLQQIIATSKK